MAATTIFFNGRVISVPGSYSEIDASGLEQVGLGATGIVAMLGTAEGGRPSNDITDVNDIVRFNKPESVRKTFRSGDLREAGSILFEPGRDADILAGAQQIVSMKVNPATQSVATLANAQGDAVDLTSVDFGAFTSQINISVANGTNQGKLISIIFEDITEAFDDVGGDNIFTLDYEVGVSTWDTMTADVAASGQMTAAGTRAELGLDGDIVTPLAAPGAIEVVSASAGDTTQKVTVYGLAGGGAAQSETLTLNGLTPVVGTLTYAAGDVLGVKIVGTTAGIVTVRPSGGGASVFDIAAGVDGVGGLVVGQAMFVANTGGTVVLDAAGAEDIIVESKNAAGALQLETVALNGTTPVPLTATMSEITAIILGDVPAARTLTTAATVAQTDAAVQDTIQKTADFFNAKQIVITGPTTLGFVMVLVTGSSNFLMADLDVTLAPVSIVGAPVGFIADLFAFINAINTLSALVTAAVATGATGGAPDNTTAPLFLTGGGEGTTVFQNWQDALNQLKAIRVNTIVALTGDPAIHAAVEAHCAFMGGVGRSERDTKLGALNAALTDVPTKNEYKAQVVDLNSRHVSLAGQASERFDTTGVRREFLPPFTACVAAGMQAGSPVGTSLTYKFANVLGFRQDSTWNPTDDAEEMIQAGALFLENVDGVGRRWVRNVTTFLTSNNIAFTEASVNEAVNFAAFNFRTNLEFAVGQPGFSGTINAAKGIAITTLGLLVDAGTITQSRSLNVELIVDVLEVEVEIAPVIPINFVTSTLHLVTVAQAAA